MVKFLIILFLFFQVTSVASTSHLTVKQRPIDNSKTDDELLKDLSADEYADREEASKELRKRAVPNSSARSPLYKKLISITERSDSPEARSRAREILKQFPITHPSRATVHKIVSEGIWRNSKVLTTENHLKSFVDYLETSGRFDEYRELAAKEYKLIRKLPGDHPEITSARDKLKKMYSDWAKLNGLTIEVSTEISTGSNVLVARVTGPGNSKTTFFNTRADLNREDIHLVARSEFGFKDESIDSYYTNPALGYLRIPPANLNTIGIIPQSVMNLSEPTKFKSGFVDIFGQAVLNYDFDQYLEGTLKDRKFYGEGTQIPVKIAPQERKRN